MDNGNLDNVLDSFAILYKMVRRWKTASKGGPIALVPGVVTSVRNPGGAKRRVHLRLNGLKHCNCTLHIALIMIHSLLSLLPIYDPNVVPPDVTNYL